MNPPAQVVGWSPLFIWKPRVYFRGLVRSSPKPEALSGFGPGERAFWDFLVVCAMAKVDLFVSCALVLLWTGCTWADFQSDLNECQAPLQKLTACLDFVGGHSKAPTKECCSDVKQVRVANPKCLCVLIKDSNNPQLNLPINQTLALEMPDLCKLDAKLSDCPAILHISPNSPDAKIFQGSNSSSASAPSSAGSSASKSSPVKAAPNTSTGNSFGLSLKPYIGLIGFVILAAAPL